MLNVIKKNPALASGLLVAALNALVEFGIALTARQVSALNALLAAVLALVIHSASTSNAALDDLTVAPPAPAKRAAKAKK